MFNYTARIYFDDHLINQHSGNKLESLFVWMLTQAQGEQGNLRGQLINNKTKLIEKEFKSCSYD